MRGRSAVISCTVRRANDNGDVWHRRIGYSIHHLGAILGDAALFKIGADDKAGDVV